MKREYQRTPPSLFELGPLEQRMLEAVWEQGDGTVRELIESQTLNVAYTTAMTTLDRLYHKHLLAREAQGRAFRYKPRITREEMQWAEAKRVVHELLRSTSGSNVLLSFLVETVIDHDAQLLDELQQIVV